MSKQFTNVAVIGDHSNLNFPRRSTAFLLSVTPTLEYNSALLTPRTRIETHSHPHSGIIYSLGTLPWDTPNVSSTKAEEHDK